MTEEEKELVKNGAKIIVTFGGVLTCLWIIYYIYDLLWK
jgi:hypothetical protein